MTLELFGSHNKIRNQREYTIIPEDPDSKVDEMRFLVRTLNQMDDETVASAT